MMYKEKSVPHSPACQENMQEKIYDIYTK